MTVTDRIEVNPAIMQAGDPRDPDHGGVDPQEVVRGRRRGRRARGLPALVARGYPGRNGLCSGHAGARGNPAGPQRALIVN